MDSIVSDALRSAPSGEQKEFSSAKVRIAVVGVGGAGTNTVSRLHRMGITSATTVAINTDANHLKQVEADKRILIGASATRGLGAGGYPEVGRKAAEMSKDKLAETLADKELVFITAGMGGGTGTGAAPVIAEIAKQQGAITIGMVNFPFALERARLSKADWGLEQLSQSCDTVVIIDNNRLVQVVPNLPMNQAFAVADTLVARSVKGIADTIMLPSLVNIDFADVKSTMGNAGQALISIGEGSGQNRVEQAIQSTLEHPLLDVDCTGAKRALIHISGGPNLSLGDVTRIGEGITQAFDAKANVIWGARVHPEMGDKVVVTAIMAGIQSPHLIAKTEQTSSKRAEIRGLESMSF